jgi:hypothetical protein
MRVSLLRWFALPLRLLYSSRRSCGLKLGLRRLGEKYLLAIKRERASPSLDAAKIGFHLNQSRLKHLRQLSFADANTDGFGLNPQT